MKTPWIITTGAFVGAMLTGCENATHTERGAATGATAGAVIGGIIGAERGDFGEGAAIGAAAGGAIGAAAGSRKDRAEREDDDVRRGRYTDGDYRDLLTDDELDILRARAEASGRSDDRLTDFLTEEEKENLRRRDQMRDVEIGR